VRASSSPAPAGAGGEGGRAANRRRAFDSSENSRNAVAGNALDNRALEATVKSLAGELGLGLGKLAQPLRAALTGQTTSPGIFDVLILLGREESLARIAEQMETTKI
jgi:glutamyl/glutaminyl-tRNA synthetase